MQQHRDSMPRSSRSKARARAISSSCARLKKMKLDIKDKIQRIETMLIPDIIAENGTLVTLHATPVAIIMGSQSDWATMKHAASTLDALGDRARRPHRLRAPHPQRLYDFATTARAKGSRSSSRVRAVLPISRHDGGDDQPPVFGVPVESKALSARIRFSLSCRCRAAFPLARWPSARQAPSMLPCSRQACSRSRTRHWRAAGRVAVGADGERRGTSKDEDDADRAAAAAGLDGWNSGGGQLARMLAWRQRRWGSSATSSHRWGQPGFPRGGRSHGSPYADFPHSRPCQVGRCRHL